MCGIVGAIGDRNMAAILVEGLKRQEYRGYDSAGVAILDSEHNIQRARRIGKVANLAEVVAAENLKGNLGIAHTRWATHGGVTQDNAHPHLSNERIALVHNGIIENHNELRSQLAADGYQFNSQTDTETMVHTVHQQVIAKGGLLAAVQHAVKSFEGAYGMVVMDKQDPDRIIVARSGSPLVIGLGIGENFIASDQLALLPVTRQFIYLEEGDVAEVTRDTVNIFNHNGEAVERKIHDSDIDAGLVDKAGYHYMLKEIHEQPTVVRNTLEERISKDGIAADIFGPDSDQLLSKVKHVQIVACGTSYHSGLTAKYWIEQYANVSCSVEIASEFRYRRSFVHADSLLVTISQSGETADTLAALRHAKARGCCPP